MVEKLEKWVMPAIVVAFLGLTGGLSYIIDRDEKEAFSQKQEYCLKLKNHALEIAESQQDKTMQLLLEKGEFCPGKHYFDDWNVVKHDIKLLETYLDNKK